MTKTGISKLSYLCEVCKKIISYYSAMYGSGLCSSCVRIGTKLTEKHKKNIRASCVGINLGNKHTLGKIPWNKGQTYKWSEEAKKYHRTRVVRGRKHPNWKGGISALSFTIRQLPEYREWRTSVFKRDNYTCLECKTKGGRLEAHHLNPFRKIIKKFKIKKISQALRCSALWDTLNGVTLCLKCHALTRGGRFND